MNSIKLNIDHAASFTGREKIAALDNEAASALDKVLNGTGAGNDFLGWVTLPTDIDAAHLADIQATADTLRSSCDYVVAIGIGGSYLGAKAVIEALQDSFAAYKPVSKGSPKVLFAGQNIGEDYLAELQAFLADKSFGIIDRTRYRVPSAQRPA